MCQVVPSLRVSSLICRSRRGSVLGWVLAAGVICSPATASQVFHSPNDDGLPGATQIPSGGVQSVFLYIDGGAVSSSPGSACNDGAGDEVCGFDLELTGLAGLTFSAFNADTGADLLVNFSAGSIRINGLDPLASSAGPQRIGELLVDAADGGGVELTSGEVIGADLGSEVLSAKTLVTAPEPASLPMLVSGLGLLLLLARTKAKR